MFKLTYISPHPPFGAGVFCLLDILAKKEYNYTYEEGQITLANECDVTLNGEIVTGKTLVNSIRYTYNVSGQKSKATIVATGDSYHTPQILEINYI